MEKALLPTTLVLFGATGDLVQKKIIPALFNIHRSGDLPNNFSVIGFSHRDISDEEYRDFVWDILKKNYDELDKKDVMYDFLSLFHYTQGMFENVEDYRKLAGHLDGIENERKTCSNRLYYLAVPPKHYEVLFTNLKNSDLTEYCPDDIRSNKQGWARVLVEKPFGFDLNEAQKLDSLMADYFTEEQIYRIDHYLAKEMLQNILAFRFSNNIFEHAWNAKFVESIDVKVWEKGGVDERGTYYDAVGALRDVGQNHLLQMLSLIAMETPEGISVEDVRRRRAEVLESLKPLSAEDIKNNTYRAQYEGYEEVAGVDPGSGTETYFRIRGEINNPRWKGVPVCLESGKRLGKQLKEVTLTFKHPKHCPCPTGGPHLQNKIVFSLEPWEEIRVEVYAKKPGDEDEFIRRIFELPYRPKIDKVQYAEEYEKLLKDAIVGDQMLFVSSREVEAMWKFIDPIICSWHDNITPLHKYKPGTMQPAEDALKKVYQEVIAPLEMKKELAVVGLGKMGSSLAKGLVNNKWRVLGYNRTRSVTEGLLEHGIEPIYGLAEIIKKTENPRVIWLMLPAGQAIDNTLDSIVNQLSPGDIVIDGGNSHYKDSKRRYNWLKGLRLNFVDVGISGGPEGALHGASIMVGGDEETFNYLKPLFDDIAVPQGVAFFEGAGAGHFVKMVHNGIEYGMMQAIAEGFTVLKNSDYHIDLKKASYVYDHGSVIESRLVSWLSEAFDVFGPNLDKVSGKVGHTGEGEWTVEAASETDVKTWVIKAALDFRKQSENDPSYTGKILSALRNRFGGHNVDD